jgi:Carboxypeptidase regulatory-like domain
VGEEDVVIRRFASFLAVVFLVSVLSVGSVHAQGLTSQISGVVTDAGGGVIPGATVVIRNVGTNLVRETVTGEDGTFVITNLLRGTFDLTVTVQGFKPYEQKGIELDATERLALRPIALEIGGLSEVVTVALQRVQHDSVSGRRYERRVRLRHWRADGHEFRPHHRCPAQYQPHHSAGHQVPFLSHAQVA